jgi:hypothetical protein
MSYLQVNIHRGHHEWHVTCWIKRPGGRVPLTVQGFPRTSTGIPHSEPLGSVLDALPLLIRRSIHGQVDEPAKGGPGSP